MLILCAYGCFLSCQYIINNAETSVICVSKQNMPALMKSVTKMPSVKHIIQWDVHAKMNNVEDVVSEQDKATCAAAGITLIGFSEVSALGKDGQPNPAGPEDIAYIMV